MDKLLEINDLNVAFKINGGEVNAVRGVNFYINKGEVLGIVGESGCGKSVTASAIMRLLPTPSTVYKRGSVNFEGRDLLKLSEKGMQKVRGKEISIVFQNSMSSLNPTMKIGEQIKEVILKHKQISKKEAKSMVLEMLSLVGISNSKERYNQYPHEFSGGMRQRVMIAIALACTPKLLIADEPTTALDVTIQIQILSILKGIAAEKNTSVLLITHDFGVVARICDRVAVMYAGKVIETANKDKIFENPLHPYTAGLISAVPTIEMDKNIILKPMYGSPPDLFNIPVGCSFFARCNKAMRICELHSPEFVDVYEEDSSFHGVACWLHHPTYKQINFGKGVSI